MKHSWKQIMALLLIASRTRFDKYSIGILGATILLVGLLFICPIRGFGFLFATGFFLRMASRGRNTVVEESQKNKVGIA